MSAPTMDVQRPEHAPAGVDAARRLVLHLADSGRTRRAAKIWSGHLLNERDRADREWNTALANNYEQALPGTDLSRRLASTSAALTDWISSLIDYGTAVAVARLVEAMRDAE